MLLAADIGGTKVAVALVTPDGRIEAKIKQPTDLSGPEAVADQIVAMRRHLGESDHLRAVGASVPAALAAPDTDTVVWAPNLPGWRDIDFRSMLHDSLGIPAFLEFDGHAAVLGEWWVGAGKGFRSVASVIIGTGIGGGFVADGRLWAGRDRLAGAMGWFPLPGPEGVDHWENLAAGPAIARRARQLLRAGQTSILDAASLSTRGIFDAARQGDALAGQVVREAAVAIGYGIATIISMANPEIVVLGGSVGQQGDVLLNIVRETVEQWAQPISARSVPIISSELGEEASLLGAAYSALLRL